ncbi:glycine-rich domain-containing protein [Escherichia coli]
MAKNDFKAFATDRNANVMSQEEWEALPALLSGFTAGKASSAQVNKVIRQASFITAALAQYTANKSGLDVLDDGDLNGFISKMEAALGKDFQALDATLTALAGLATAADKLPYFTGNDTASLTTLTNVGRDILAKTSKQEVIHYLGLGATNGYVGRLVNTRVFTSSGTYTPTPGTKRIRVTITGGGGGGGGCKAISNNETFFGAGGGAGGTIISIMTPTQNSYPVTIGAGGAGGVSATYGINGGNSLFASLIAPGGAGGTSYWGGGGRAGAGGGVSGKAYGSGGGGAYDAGYSGTSMTGGKGAAGICIIEEFA